MAAGTVFTATREEDDHDHKDQHGDDRTGDLEPSRQAWWLRPVLSIILAHVYSTQFYETPCH
jgi:hypothetical protein